MLPLFICIAINLKLVLLYFRSHLLRKTGKTQIAVNEYSVAPKINDDVLKQATLSLRSGNVPSFEVVESLVDEEVRSSITFILPRVGAIPWLLLWFRVTIWAILWRCDHVKMVTCTKFVILFHMGSSCMPYHTLIVYCFGYALSVCVCQLVCIYVTCLCMHK